MLELRDEGLSLQETAVLYRSHYHSLELQLELTRRGIPYRVRSGVRFFEQAHIKDVVSYLRLVTNPRDELAWKRVLRLVPNVGPATANRVWERIAYAPDPVALVVRGEADAAAAKRGTGWAEFRALLEELVRDEARNNPARQIEVILARGYEAYLEANYENAEARLEDLRQLAHYSARYSSTEEFLAELALLSTERYGAPQAVAGEDVVSGGDEDELSRSPPSTRPKVSNGAPSSSSGPPTASSPRPAPCATPTARTKSAASGTSPSPAPATSSTSPTR